MKKILLLLFCFILMLHLVDLLIYSIPIEITINGIGFFVKLTFPISLAGLSMLLIYNWINKNHKIKYLYFTIGFCGLLLSFFIAAILSFWRETSYVDQFIVYQSLQNKREKIIQQYMDEGALGSHWREVRVFELIPGIRYSDRFCSTVLNGNWMYTDFHTGNSDTVLYNSYIYKSEINKSQNWTFGKCK